MNGITGSSPVLEKYGYLGSAGTSAVQDESEGFLQLLVSQLKNQNPLEPLDNGEFIQQLASFSEVEEASKLNAQIGSLIQLQELLAGQNAFTQSADLVGKTVTYLDPTTGDEKTGFVQSVTIGDAGLTLDIDGTSVPVSSVTGLIAEGKGGDDDDASAEADEESGADSDSNEEN